MSAAARTRVLVVEDDPKISRSLTRFLAIEGFDARAVGDGESGIEEIRNDPPDLVLLDLMLPGKDGIEVCAEVRPAFSAPILMLTASDDEADELMALNTGIDDFVTKPVRLPLLLARIRALLRRAGSGGEATRYEIQDLVLDRGTRTLTRSDEAIVLTDTEFELIWLLARHRGEPVSRERLFREVLGREYNGLDRAIDMKVSILRKKLGDDATPPRYLRSLRGRGYILV